MDGPLEIMIHTKISQQRAGMLPHGCVMIMNIHLLSLNKLTGPAGLCNTTESQNCQVFGSWAIFCETVDIRVTRLN